MIILGDVFHGREIARRAGIGFDPEVDRVISRVTPEGNFWGGFIFTNFTKTAIQIHMAGGRGWATREMVCLCFDYPFNQLKVGQCLATVASTNPEALEIVLKVGFEPLTLIPAAVEGGDMLILSMSRSDCRWLTMGDRYLRKKADRQELAA